MSRWDNIYLRSCFNDLGQPSGPLAINRAMGLSPDVIPYGVTEMADDLSALTTGLESFVDQGITFGSTNYLYVRGVNNSVPAQGLFSLYYCEMSTVLTPGLWSANSLSAAGATGPVPVLDTPPFDVALPAQAFAWSNVPTPLVSSAYSLIGIYTDPPSVLHPLPSAPFTTPDQFVAWVISTPNLATHSVMVLAGGNSATLTVQVANIDTTNTRNYLFAGSSYGMPLGTTVALSTAANVTPAISGSMTTFGSQQSLVTPVSLPPSWGPYALTATITAPSGTTLAGSLFLITQMLVEDDLMAGELRPFARPLAVPGATGTSAVYTGCCTFSFTGSSDGGALVRPPFLLRV